jgi:hypothetical protein
VDWGRRLGISGVGRLRLVVIVAAGLATVLKVELAARTLGSNDVYYWGIFADGVRRFGPVGIYGHAFDAPVYNHGPLAGWMLVAINWLVDRGVASFHGLMRMPACLADFVTSLLVFELVRAVRSTREAAIAAVLVVWSPLLFAISGFHGNTDPVFVMFALLSVYLLVIRDWSLAAGAAFGIAMSIKLVPVVLAPVLLVVLVRLGWRRLAAFAGGVAIVFWLLWVPVILTRWDSFRTQVFGYSGSHYRQWGLPQLLTWADLPGAASWLAGPGRFAVLLVSGLAAAAVVWRRPGAAVAAAGLSFVLFLLLSSAFAMQYLVWGLAAAYLIHTWAATAYNAAVSAFAVVVYDHWNNAPPWHWYQAWAVPLVRRELPLMVLTWAALASVAVAGLRILRGGTATTISAGGPIRRWGSASADRDFSGSRTRGPRPLR